MLAMRWLQNNKFLMTLSPRRPRTMASGNAPAELLQLLVANGVIQKRTCLCIWPYGQFEG